jgi:hypothetical protein
MLKIALSDWPIFAGPSLRGAQGGFHFILFNGQDVHAEPVEA